MTKQEIIDVVFKDPQVIKNLKDNKLEECLNHIQSYYLRLTVPQGYPSIGYIYFQMF